MYYTPDNYKDMEVGATVRDIHFNILWTVIENNGEAVIIQTLPPNGVKMCVSKENSNMEFYG